MMPKPAIMQISADEHGLAALRAFVEQQARARGAAPAAAIDLVVAANEIATNIVTHGYRGRPGTIDLEVLAEAGALIVRLRDRAPPFDVTQVPAPDITRPLEQRAPGGLGIQLARRFTDEMRYQRTPDGNETSLIKRDVAGAQHGA